MKHQRVGIRHQRLARASCGVPERRFMGADQGDGEFAVRMVILADVAEIEHGAGLQRGQEEDAGEYGERAERDERVGRAASPEPGQCQPPSLVLVPQGPAAPRGR